MDLIPAYNKKKEAVGRDSSGIALFMVIASISVLAILVTEFTYIAQISQSIAFGALDQAKAHYLAKSGLKISLLRLKAYQQAKSLLGAAGAAGLPGIPRSALEKIWNFPFSYPIPTNIPGMTLGDKTAVEKFQKESSLDGKIFAVIESESSKYNLNLILESYQPNPAAAPTPTPSPTPSSSPTPAVTFSPEEARNNLLRFLTALINQKTEADPDFSSNFRDLKLDELLDQIVAWADRSYERRTSNSQDKIPMKRAPFDSISELHMLPSIDDEIYNLFAPNLTANRTPGININTMQEPILRVLVPDMTKEEVSDFFKFRDSLENDNTFKNPDDFFSYLLKGVSIFKGNQQVLDSYKADLVKNNIQLITDETQFKITVRAEVNNAIRTIEAWVTLGSSPSPSKTQPNAPSDTSLAGTPQTTSGSGPKPPDSGLKITFMKIL